MASPFHVFRKHQRILIAVIGVMAMVAFVFIPILLQTFDERSSGGGPKDKVVTTDKYGDINEQTLSVFRSRKMSLVQFLASAIAESGGNPQMISRLMGDTSEETVVGEWLMAQKAKSEGMQIDDAMVSETLRSLTGGQLSNAQLTELLKKSRLSEDMLFDTLKEFLLARQQLGLFQSALGGFNPSQVTLTPGQKWDYFQRLNRKVDAEVIPIDVAAFVEEVKDPGDKVLEAYFDEYKNQYANPNRATPGFRLPPRIDVEYIKADVEKLGRLDLDAVTDVEIEGYYIANRDLEFQALNLPGLDIMSIPGEEEAKADEAKPADKSEVDKPAAEVKAEVKPAEKPAEAKPVEVKPTEEKPAADEPAAKPADDKNSDMRRKSPFRLVAFEAEKKDDKGAKTEVKEEKPAEKPAEVKPAADKPADALKSTLPSLPGSLGMDAADKVIGQKKYKPLSDVKDDIRRKLAIQKSAAAVGNLLKPLHGKMRGYHNSVLLFEAESAEGKTDVKKPEFNLADEIKGTKLEIGQTGMKTYTELSELDLAGAMIDGQIPALRELFTGLPEHQPRTAQDSNRDYYLFWKVGSEDERVPEFTDEGIREEVLTAWKFDQARKLAQKKADELAKKAIESKKPFDELFAGQADLQVKRTGPFSWMTLGNIPSLAYRMQPRLGRVEHVDLAGDAFMRAVYGLKVGEVAVAPNHPESVFYLIRLADSQPSQKVLWSMFIADKYLPYGTMAQGEKVQATRRWIGNLEKEANLKWERDPVDPNTGK
jgi:SurA-like N-terminal domain